MAFDAAKPADDDFLSAFPAEMREQLRALVHDQVVDAMHIQGLSPGNLNGNIAVNNGTLNKNLNAEMLDGHAATYYSPEEHVHAVATSSSDGFMANTDKVKLEGISAGAEVNQNAFSNVVIGDKTIQADSKTDTLTFEAGANIQITPDPTNDKITIAITGTVQSAVDSKNAESINNTGTVTLATAIEANQIDITQPSYSPGKPVKLLNFNWYSNRYSIGAVRGGSSDIAGLGIYLNDSNICSWDSKGDLELYTSDGSEKRIYGTGNNCGFSVYQSGLALFDWKNGRNIWNYNQSDNNILCDVSPRFSGDNAITLGPNTGWGGC